MSYFDNFKETEVVPGIPGFNLAKRFSPTVVEGDVGLELELEASNNLPMPSSFSSSLACPKTKSRWDGHVDNSLRGNALEYVLNRPCSIDSVEPLVHGLYEELKAAGTTLKLSNRCSTHVHLNVSDWKVPKITSLLLLWYALEPVLISWCGSERKSNHFCLALKDTDGTLRSWATFLNEGRLDFPNGLKYSALNILHLMDFGSVEIRIGRASTDPDDVVKWAKFLWAMKKAVDDRYENPVSVGDDVSMTQPAGILSRICLEAGIPEFADELLREAGDANINCFDSFREAQALAYAYPWEQWVPLSNQVYIENPFESGKAKKSPTPRLPDHQLEAVLLRTATARPIRG